jgi:hypothetical protein
MAEPMTDAERAFLARLRELVDERDALRAALRELRDAAEGLDGLPGGSGGRYARALLEAGRLLGEGDGG